MSTKLTKKEQSALKKFRKALEKAFDSNLLEVRLFGSKARGDGHKDSDLDVLVVTAEGDWHLCDVAYDIITDIMLDDGIYISPKVINKKQYDQLYKMQSPFIKNVIREGITI